VLKAQHILFRLAAVATLASGLMMYPSIAAEPNGPKGRQDPALFWTIWGLEGEAAKACKTETEARNFLETAGGVAGDPEHSKVFADVVESLATENPTCFLSAANSMEPQALRIMIDQFLAHPRRHSSKDIEASLAKYWEKGPHAKIRKLYFEARR
jgi:ABC-type hemin transport system substrate-binding protein